MRLKTTLLTGAAAIVALASATSADASAKSAHRHKANAAQAALEQKVETLSAAVADLETRLNDETQARLTTEQQAKSAQADAAAARADAAAAHAELAQQIQTLPGEVSATVAADIPKPKPSWTDNTTLGGTVFADISNLEQTPRPNKINGTGADIKRAYLSVDHKFNDIYSANVTVDLAPNGIILNGGTFGTGTDQGSEVLKYAYLQAHYSDALIVQVGEQKTPWIPFVEDVYGYRYIDKIMVDQNKFGTSADFGANIHGALAHGLINYSASVENGAGYKNAVRSQAMDFEGRINLNWKGFIVAVGGYTGQLSNDINTTPATAYQTAQRIDALVAYTNDRARIGVEYFDANNWKVTTKRTPDRSEGVSVFGSYVVVPKWSVFARYDAVTPSKTLDPAERYSYYDGGIQYEASKNLDLALVFKHESISNAIAGGYADGTTTLAPGSTLSYNTATHLYTRGSGNPGGAANEIGLYTLIKF